MDSTNTLDWTVVRKRFFIAFVAALLIAVPVFFATGRFRDPNGGTILLLASSHLWCICAGFAWQRIPLPQVIAVAAGFTWGFLLSLSIAISIENGRVSVFWPTMIPGLILIPVAVAAFVRPLCFLNGIRQAFRNGMA